MTQILSNIARRDDRVAPVATLSVETIADLVCPFCFIGKRRLDEALKAVQGPTEVSWYPYQLNPTIPEDGLAFEDYLTQRFGNPSDVAPVLNYLESEGKSAGINFRFDLLRHVPNTLALHQLMQFAESRGVAQTALAEDLMSAFFEDGKNIGKTDELVDIAGPHGISAADISDAVNSEKLRQMVVSREAQVRSAGLAGIPGFLMNKRLLVVGAQSTETIINAFDQAMFGDGADAVESPALH
ncbi:MAG: DsbA family oxidoreductase [Gammaproteobacteria bacterium]|nr:DsbA family oxidoreductase [Gammaproteobacteria bacterium]